MVRSALLLLESHAPIDGARSFVGAGLERLGLALADGHKVVGGNSVLDIENADHLFGTLLGQRLIVGIISEVAGMPLDLDLLVAQAGILESPGQFPQLGIRAIALHLGGIERKLDRVDVHLYLGRGVQGFADRFLRERVRNVGSFLQWLIGHGAGQGQGERGEKGSLAMKRTAIKGTLVHGRVWMEWELR